MIDLPSYPAPSGATPALVDFGGVQGLQVEQRVNRLGNRFRLSVTMPPMPSRDLGRIWVSRLIRGKTEGVRMEYPLLSFSPGTPGTTVVDGADQAGRTLDVRGATPNYAVREGQPFSIEDAAGQHYLHFADGQALADAGGNLSIGLSPMLRQLFADGATVHLGKPMIEGVIQGEEWEWEMMLDHNLGFSFVIQESA